MNQDNPYLPFAVLTEFRDMNLLRCGFIAASIGQIGKAGLRLYEKLGTGSEKCRAADDWVLTEVYQPNIPYPTPMKRSLESLVDDTALRADRFILNKISCQEDHLVAQIGSNSNFPYFHISEHFSGRTGTALPLYYVTSLFGVLIIEAEQIPAEIVAIVQTFALIYGNQQQLIRLSVIDNLTKLYNRHAFDEKVVGLINASLGRRGGEEKAGCQSSNVLAILDIDCFKKVNDEYGHLFGDEVLVLIAELMRANFRAEDWLFRFGGEEFVILMRQLSLVQAGEVLERFRVSVERYTFPQIGTLTLSIGYTEYRPEFATARVIGQADDALYFAKSAGRNRVECYESLIESGFLSARFEKTGDVDLF